MFGQERFCYPNAFYESGGRMFCANRALFRVRFNGTNAEHEYRKDELVGQVTSGENLTKNKFLKFSNRLPKMNGNRFRTCQTSARSDYSPIRMFTSSWMGRRQSESFGQSARRETTTSPSRDESSTFASPTFDYSRIR